MPSCNDTPGNWLIQIPLNELAELQTLPARMGALENENTKLRRELEGCRGMLSDALVLIAELRSRVNKLSA